MRKRLERIEQHAGGGEFEKVIARMWARAEIVNAERAKDWGLEVRELSPEAKKLLEEDSVQSRRADKAVWERHAKANKITDLAAAEGRLYIPLEVRLKRYAEEDGSVSPQA